MSYLGFSLGLTLDKLRISFLSLVGSGIKHAFGYVLTLTLDLRLELDWVRWAVDEVLVTHKC